MGFAVIDNTIVSEDSAVDPAFNLMAQTGVADILRFLVYFQ